MLDKYDYESNNESNKILSLIVEKTFDGFEKLIDKTGRNNNFLDCINKINIIDVSSVNYENLSNNITTIVETVEQIKQNSVGFSQGLELLTNFDNANSLRMVFIYIRELKKEAK